MNFHALSRAPLREHLTDELRAIIHSYPLGKPPSREKHPSAGKDRYRYGLTVMVV